MEGFRAYPYDDQTGQRITSWVEGATIGYGLRIPDYEKTMVEYFLQNPMSEQQAEEYLMLYINLIEAKLFGCLPIHEISQHQLDALIILAYNIGENAACWSSVADFIRGYSTHEGWEYPDIESAWKAWKYSQGKVNQGLINRRNIEWKLFSTGQYGG